MMSWSFRADALLFALVLGMAGCAKAASSQLAAAAQNPCDVDASSMCQTARSAPVVDMSTGITEDNRAREQNSPMTVSEVMQYPLKSGNSLEVECLINTHTQKLIYAKASPAEPLTAEDVDFLRAQGACKE